MPTSKVLIWTMDKKTSKAVQEKIKDPVEYLQKGLAILYQFSGKLGSM